MMTACHPIDTVNDQMLIQSLASRTCPYCGGRKDEAKTLCNTDYFRLGSSMRSMLYRRVGNGYLEAVTAAIKHLASADRQDAAIVLEERKEDE